MRVNKQDFAQFNNVIEELFFLKDICSIEIVRCICCTDGTYGSV
jgi:hypothetical protein